MENNRKGNGIFLGIVSVSTLVVAIIGATFAFFSASTQSEEDAVNLQAYEFSLSMTVSPVFPEGASKIIPLSVREDDLVGDTGMNKLEYALNSTGRAYSECIDDNGLQVCALYKVEIRNNNTNPITLGGKIRTVTNTPGEGTDRTAFTNLTYQSSASDSLDPKTNHDMVLLGEGDTIPDTTLTAVGTKTLSADVDGLVDIDPIYVPGATAEDEPGIGTAFVLIYLNDNGDQSAEMGAKFTGQVIYSSSGDASTGLTGTFKVGGTEEEPETGE